MSATPEDTEEASREPGWIADTNAADIGKQDAMMIHGYWATLRSQTPKMPDDLVDSLTSEYQQYRLGIPDAPDQSDG